MKKMGNKGFVLAETLIVSVFLMVMFTMIYSNFYPLIGEYEKRENYDDVDGKYTAYWVKKMIESDGYIMNPTTDASSQTRIKMMNQWGYMRFECKDMTEDNNQREMCKNLVNALEISNCDSNGNGCDIYITRYTLDYKDDGGDNFKRQIREESLKRWNEVCIDSSNYNDATAATATTSSCASVAFQDCCVQKGLTTCTKPILSNNVNDYSSLYTGSDSEKFNDIAKYCNNRLLQKSFTSATKDYILSLPNYSINHTTTGARYRVIVIVHHLKDNNNYYSFSTMEVIR